MFSQNINLIETVSILEQAGETYRMIACKRGNVCFCEPFKHERSDAILHNLGTVFVNSTSLFSSQQLLTVRPNFELKIFLFIF